MANNRNKKVKKTVNINLGRQTPKPKNTNTIKEDKKDNSQRKKND